VLRADVAREGGSAVTPAALRGRRLSVGVLAGGEHAHGRQRSGRHYEALQQGVIDVKGTCGHRRGARRRVAWSAAGTRRKTPAPELNHRCARRAHGWPTPIEMCRRPTGMRPAALLASSRRTSRYQSPTAKSRTARARASGDDINQVLIDRAKAGQSFGSKGRNLVFATRTAKRRCSRLRRMRGDPSQVGLVDECD